MCGIFGILNNKEDSNKLNNALGLMSHRGPDNSDSYIDNNIFLGHNRLSILDLNNRSNQPFFIGEYVIVYNGEIYNYLELAKEFNLNVSTSSDTEVVLMMYIKLGVKCLDHLNGMFTFIIYNTNTKDTFIARDRLGIKPLFFKQNSNQAIFSSEISSILNLFPDKISSFGLRQYYKLRMTIKGYTIYENIKEFLPGHYWLNGKIHRYWDLDTNLKNHPSDEQLDYLIRDSVKIRLRSDVKVGTYLSGGLDSTILSYIAKPNNTWSVGFKEMNEFKWAEVANQNLNSIFHKTLVDKNEFIENALWMIKKRREPLSVPNEVLIYLMTKNVKKLNTVILSGEGADELFLGYDRIFSWAYNADSLNLREFDKFYCYGSKPDDEVLDFALEGLPGKSVFEKISYFFQIYHLKGLLRRLDNSTMLCSVEARVPFVDHRLVELIAGTPFEWRMGPRIKEPLKRIYKNLIPEEVINRKKIGFPVPLENIFNYKKGKPMDSWIDFNIKSVRDNL